MKRTCYHLTDMQLSLSLNTNECPGNQVQDLTLAQEWRNHSPPCELWTKDALQILPMPYTPKPSTIHMGWHLFLSIEIKMKSKHHTVNSGSWTLPSKDPSNFH